MLTTSQAAIWELPDHERPVEGLDRRGDPDPAYATALGLVSAPLGRRASACAIDISCFVLLQVPLAVFAAPLFWRLLSGRITWYGFRNHPDFLISVVVAGVTLLVSVLLLVAQLWVQGRWGFTLGKLATGVRVIDVRTLAAPGWGPVTWRALTVWLPVVTVLGTVLFLLSPWWSRHDRRRGWHDRAGRVWLVDVRHGLDPYDEKRMRLARKTVTSKPAVRAKSLPSLASTGGSHATQPYRPGARTSAGVLGAARPHTPQGRVVVGLTGLVPGEPEPVSAEATGPRLGAYLSQPPAGGPPTGPPPGPLGTDRVLVFDNGQRLQFTSAVVLGRSPESIAGAVPMTVVDPEFSISKTHVLLRPVPAGLEVIDQGSTNGTALVHHGHERTLSAGEVAVAGVGDAIRLGDLTARLQGS